MKRRRGKESEIVAPSSSASAAKSDRVLRSNSRSSEDHLNGVITIIVPPIHPSEDFRSCLHEVDDSFQFLPEGTPNSRQSSSSFVLLRALSIQELDDDSWLSSSFMNLVISQFAKQYKSTYFMSVDFVFIGLSTQMVKAKSELETITDITGQRINYSDQSKPIVFICNAQNIHWYLIRVRRWPEPELELFEPIGKPSNRHGGLSFRQVPRQVIAWLDTCCPLPNGKTWLTAGLSAITQQQQYTNFDCGVACLLYAEKCGQGQVKEEINDCTTQEDITKYRTVLQAFMQRMHQLQPPAH